MFVAVGCYSVDPLDVDTLLVESERRAVKVYFRNRMKQKAYRNLWCLLLAYCSIGCLVSFANCYGCHVRVSNSVKYQMWRQIVRERRVADEAVSNCCSCDLCVAQDFHVPRRLVVILTHSWLTLAQAFEFRAMNGITFPVKRAFT